MTTAEAAVAATKAYITRLALVRANAAGLIAAIWLSLEGYDEANVDEFATRSAPILQGAQQASVSLTAGLFGLVAGSGSAPDLSAITILQDPRHPFIGTWKGFKDGGDGVSEGLARARGMADERAMLAQQATAQRIDATGRTVGWRRVPQGPTCNYCVVVSTQRYHTAESASAVGHRNKGRLTCDCSIVPIVGFADPGRVINRPVLDAWKQAGGAKKGPAYFDAETMGEAPRPDAKPRPDRGASAPDRETT